MASSLRGVTASSLRSKYLFVFQAVGQLLLLFLLLDAIAFFIQHFLPHILIILLCFFDIFWVTHSFSHCFVVHNQCFASVNKIRQQNRCFFFIIFFFSFFYDSYTNLPPLLRSAPLFEDRLPSTDVTCRFWHFVILKFSVCKNTVVIFSNNWNNQLFELLKSVFFLSVYTIKNWVIFKFLYWFLDF